MCGLPLGHPFLHFLQLFHRDARAHVLPVGNVLILLRRLDCGRQIEPVVGLHIALRHPLPHHVKHGQRALRGGVSLVRSFAIPGGRLHLVAQHSAAIPVQFRKMHFAGSASLLGGFAIPLRRLFQVLRDIHPRGIFFAHRNLGGLVPCRRFGHQPRINPRRLRQHQSSGAQSYEEKPNQIPADIHNPMRTAKSEPIKDAGHAPGTQPVFIPSPRISLHERSCAFVRPKTG